ncbi:LPXTG cell wall anchor domain-containing protein [Ornithinibacillus sp. L9]|uniref:LPXTG cell wall anchor domain-containing protein n=1 Tax=Ornithinibacillus caprae TaxID=2678566 RepID=A0A6N8FCW6_9BACI|nr:GDSL-type esterase/lipase family protein [Ornithinibacillus caprae]MUK87400.1 LPXTG cell wall anchor domain-containing protein [Ornithinibacillus caprae]
MNQVRRTCSFLVVITLFLSVFIPQVAFADEGEKNLYYVALGDSLAAGTDYNNQLGNGYPDYITESLNEYTDFDVNLNNMGVPGYRTDQVLEQISDPEVLAELAAADIITLSAGANDVLQAVNIKEVDFSDPEQVAEVIQIATEKMEQVAANISTTIATIKQVNPDVLVYVMGYYNALPYMDEGAQAYILTLIDGLNSGIAGGAQAMGATFVPTFDAFDGKYEDYLPNEENIHPNEAGYRALSQLFLPFIYQDIGEGGWIFNAGEPEVHHLGSSYYVDTNTLNVYEKVDYEWQLVGNYNDGSGKVGELELLYGSGIPPRDAGEVGQLYLDVGLKYLYVKEEAGWAGLIDLNTMEAIDNPSYPDQIFIDQESLDAVEENGVLSIALRGQATTSEVVLTREQIQLLNEKNAMITIHNGEVALQIPPSVLNDTKEEAVITVENLGGHSGSLSDVYDFTISIDGTTISEFEEGIAVAFKVDEAKVTNTDYVKVFYFNEDASEWELIGGEYEDGAVVAITNHFSKFAVFEHEKEDEEDTNDENEEGNNDQKENENGNEDPKEKEEKEGSPGAKNKKSSGDKKEQTGKKLPDTATNMYSILLAGVLFTLAGLALYLFARRKVA